MFAVRVEKQSLQLLSYPQPIVITSYPTNTIVRSYILLKTSCLTAIVLILRLAVSYTNHALSTSMLRNCSRLPENFKLHQTKNKDIPSHFRIKQQE